MAYKLVITRQVRDWLRELRKGDQNAVLLVAGDKSGRWQQWYRESIPLAEALYDEYLKELS